MDIGLIRKPPSESTLHIAVFTSQVAYIEGAEVVNFVSFEVDQPAYVYLLNISPESDGQRDVRLLLPSAGRQNYFSAKGVYSLSTAFPIEGPPGQAHVQAIATPSPIGLPSFSGNGDFQPLGTNVERVLAGFQLLIQDKGLATGSWAADWASYTVLPSLMFSAPPDPQDTRPSSQCSNLIVQIAPDLAQREIAYEVDATCTKPRTGTWFAGQTTRDEFEVPVGQRTVCLTPKGLGQKCKSVSVQADSAAHVPTFFFSDFREDSGFFDFTVDPTGPGIWEPITFKAVAPSSKQASIIGYEWDFGDGGQAQGAQVPHIYTDPTIAGRGYLVELTINFRDGTLPRRIAKELDVSSPPQCPAPLNISQHNFASSMVFEIQERVGCIKTTVPTDLIQNYDRTASGKLKVVANYEWTIPTGVRAQAFLVASYQDQTGRPVDADVIPLPTSQTASTLFFEIPSGASDLQLKVSLNVIDNANPGPQSVRLLKVNPFQLEVLPSSCVGTRLDLLDSNGETPFAFEPDELIIIRLTNGVDCPTIEMPESGISIVKDGVLATNLSIPRATIAPNSEMKWSWKAPSDDNVEGVYTMELKTEPNAFTNQFIIAASHDE